MKTRDWIIVGGVAVAAWIVYRKFTGAVTAIPKALTAIGEGAGGALYDWFHPNESKPDISYYVRFTNGAFYIPSQTVDDAGAFTFRGQRFRIKNDANGNHYAVTP